MQLVTFMDGSGHMPVLPASRGKRLAILYPAA